MPYTFEVAYFGTTAMTDGDDLSAITGSINSWADEPNADETREYIWLRHQNSQDEFRVRLELRDIDDLDATLDDFADFIDLELNGPYNLSLPVPPNGTSVVGVEQDE